MTYARITGTGSYLPDRIVTNKDLEATVQTSDEWIVSRTGIRERRIAADGQFTSDLAMHASRRALEAAGRTPADVDLIVLATSTPDMVFPSSACLLQAKLGVKRGAAFDVQAVCTGFAYALATADLFIKSGRHACALVVGAEIFSRILDWKDRGTCVLFGDGAGAVVLEASDKPGILTSNLHADGSHAGILNVPGPCLRRARCRAIPRSRWTGARSSSSRCASSRRARARRSTRRALKVGDLDAYIPHQANVRIISHVAKKLGLAESKCDRHRRPPRQHLRRLHPARARRRRARRAHPPRQPRAAAGRGRRVHVGLGPPEVLMSLAIVLPGPGIPIGRNG
jgi:3-oxoacyl-[acyl-carrier-protein] synthase-3